MPFYIQIATSQSEAQLMTECPRCGAVTYLPLAYAWPARSVSCSECATKITLGLNDMTKLKAQAAAGAAEIARLLTTA